MLFEVREKPEQANETEGITEISDPKQQKPDERAEQERRHGILMECLQDERDRQTEERLQMAIDADYYDHLHWREEDAMTLISRGQAPLVFNESRLTIDWVSGMQKRMRTDYKILPRKKGDEKAAETKTELFKYISDVNLAAWHETRAFKQTICSGLGWLEEGVSVDPETETVFSGSECWRNVFRDSRDRSFDLQTSRYLFRRKTTDADFAVALFPQHRDHLLGISSTDSAGEQEDDIWYLGQKLTGSTDLSVGSNLPASWRDRSAYIGGSGYADNGRRQRLDLLECWYRVPMNVEVFDSGPFNGKVFNAADWRHVQAKSDRYPLYQTVAWRMRVMIATEDAPLWDGPSPFRHNRFLLVPIWGYRRERDGMCYGLMRGMRDLNDDLNKRASKALWAASSNRVVAKKNAVEDVEAARDEAARPDMWLEVDNMESIRFEKPMQDLQANMELITFDREMLRNMGGVTDANLGRDSRAQSGVAIGKVQDQGTLTTSELPDNLRLAKQLAGRLRLSHIEQFMTEERVVRLTGKAKPLEWLEINKLQEDGSRLNDIAESECDFIISESDYQSSYMQAALVSILDLFGKLAQYAPQVVLNTLDLLVDAHDIPNKEEWVARIRAINKQRDASKPMTPEEQAAAQADKAKAETADRIQIQTAMAQLKKLQAEGEKLDTAALQLRIQSLYESLQAAQIVATVPQVAPIADEIAKSGGYVDQAGTSPQIPEPGQPVQMMPPPQAQQADGAANGIETMSNDGAQPQLNQPQL